MRLGEVILLEAKDDYVVKAFGPKIATVAKLKFKDDADRDQKVLEFVRNNLVPLDPTPNQKFLVWIAALYGNGNLESEDFYKVPEELTIFQKVQQKLPVKDIMQYKNLPDLSDALNPFREEDAQKSGKSLAKSEKDQLFDKGEAVLTLKTSEYTVVEPRSKSAAKILGKGTRWCTSATNNNAFDSYYQRSVLYIIYSKVPGGPHQLSVDRKGRHYMNEPYLADSSDRTVSNSIIRQQFPELADHILKNHSYLSGTLKGTQSLTRYVTGYFHAAHGRSPGTPDRLLHLRPIEELVELFDKLPKKEVLGLIEQALGRARQDSLDRLSAVATGKVKPFSIPDLRTLGVKLNTDAISKSIKAGVIDLDTPLLFKRWSAFLGIEDDVENVLLNSGQFAISGNFLSQKDTRNLKPEILKKLPTVFSEYFDQLSPENKLKALVTNLSGRGYGLVKNSSDKVIGVSLEWNKKDTPHYEDMFNTFKKPIQGMIKNMSKGIESEDTLTEFKRRIDLGVSANAKKLKSLASAKAVVRPMLMNLLKMKQPITKQSATYYFLNQVLEQNPANKEVIFQSVLDDLVKDRKSKSGTIEEKKKDIGKIKAYIEKTAKTFNAAKTLTVSADATRADAKGIFVSKLPWTMARSKLSRGRLTHREVQIGTKNNYAAIDEAMKKIRMAHDTLPPFSAIALTKNFILASPIYAIVVNYATPEKPRIVRTGELLKVASKDLRDQIEKYMQVKSLEIDPTAITARDLI